MTYGFAFNSLKNQEEFFTQSTSVADSFQIMKRGSNDWNDLQFTPAIFYSYLPYENREKKYYTSFTAGLGFDTESPVGFLGVSLFFRQNIGASLGFVFKKVNRLRGEYEEFNGNLGAPNTNGIVREQLSFDQLHESVYRPLIYFSIHFRFGKNPFVTKDTPESGGG